MLMSGNVMSRGDFLNLLGYGAALSLGPFSNFRRLGIRKLVQRSNQFIAIIMAL